MLTLTARGQESPPSVLHLPGSVTCVVHPNHHTHAPSMLHLLSLPKTEACRCRYGAWFHPTRHCPSSATSSSGSASHSPGSTCWRRCGLSPSAPAAGDAYVPQPPVQQLLAGIGRRMQHAPAVQHSTVARSEASMHRCLQTCMSASLQTGPIPGRRRPDAVLTPCGVDARARRPEQEQPVAVVRHTSSPTSTRRVTSWHHANVTGLNSRHLSVVARHRPGGTCTRRPRAQRPHTSTT